MENITENPWDVENLEEFLYFCCPECDLKDSSKMNFLQHALEQHPNAKECAKLHNFFVKNEPYDDQISYNLEKEYRDILKCEVKIENKDQNDRDNLEISSENREYIPNKKFNDDFVIEEHKNIRCKSNLLHENEILENLVEKFGLN